MAPIPEVFPFAGVDGSWRYPAWIRGLRRTNGVYVFRERRTGEVVYVGESHSERLYSTLTRHFQTWTDKYDTAGATYARDEVDVAVIVVPAEHAVYLQNKLICALIPRDNRLQCEQLFGLLEDDDNDTGQRYPDYGELYDPNQLDDPEVDEEAYEIELTSKEPPPGYDYDIPALLQAITYEFDQETANTDEYVPF